VESALHRPEGPRPQPHACVADHRAQAGPPLLPRPARTRPRRPGPNHNKLTSPNPPDALRHAQPSSMITLPASSLSSRGSHPRMAAHH